MNTLHHLPPLPKPKPVRLRDSALPLLLLPLLAVLPASAPAQQAGDVVSEVGFVQIVNGVSTGEPTFIRFGDVEAGQSEIPAGATSGMMGLEPGDYAFEIRNAACEPEALSGTITLEAGKTFALVFFNDVVVSEEEGGEDRFRLRHTALTRQHEHTEPKLSLVSLSRSVDLSVKVGKNFVTLRQYRAVDVDIEAGDVLPVASGGEEIGTIEAIAPVHYVGFVFDHPSSESGFGFSQIQHQRIVYDPPSDLDDEDEDEDENEDGENEGAGGDAGERAAPAAAAGGGAAQD